MPAVVRSVAACLCSEAVAAPRALPLRDDREGRAAASVRVRRRGWRVLNHGRWEVAGLTSAYAGAYSFCSKPTTSWGR